MNGSSTKVLNYLTGYTDILTVPVEDLQKLADENPYFPITQYLLAEKLKSESNDAFELQAQKTSLYFANPYWLQYQLTEQHLNGFTTDSKIAVIPGNHILSADTDNGNITRVSPLGSTPHIGSEATVQHPVTLEYGDILPAPSLESIDQPEADTANTLVSHEEINSLTNDDEVEGQQLANATENDEFVEQSDNLESGIQSNTTAENVITVLPASAEKEVIGVQEEMAGAAHDTNESTTTFLEETHNQSVNEETPPEDEHDRMFQNIKAMLDATSEEAGADTTDTIIPMDPYYTIDYFASQGIKLALDPNPQDKLGQNLKKFTHWLRHMKKLGPEDATETINKTETEADIQQIADSSNTVREVVTEAMATVLEKQGKKDKAIELYNKLSFLNPHKRAYFADKIKILKGI